VTFLFFFLITVSLIAQKSQKIKLPLTQSITKSQNLEKVKSTSYGITIIEQIQNIEFVEKETKEGIYLELLSEGMIKTFNQGKPDLPVFSKLIEIPLNKKALIKIIGFEEQIINLKDYNLKKEIYPAQPSIAKSVDPKDAPFYKRKDIYSKNEFFKNELISFEDKGYLRNKHLGYIEISPFEYNPVSNTVKVINNIQIEIVFEDDANATRINTNKLNSPFFSDISYNTINSTEVPESLISGPVKYVIVSDPMFETVLQAFIEWKTMKGFNVIAAYTDEIGTTTTAIKTYLKDLYDNPADGISPSFVLLVGDVTQIPAFSNGHATDLYYAEYTGDRLPEVFIGRFSAETVEELQPQINKTLEVERFEMSEPSYLENVVLVAGVDGTYASKWGNGAINYANTYYTNEDNDINSYYYLYNDASGVMMSNSSGASESIRNNISAGVSLGNYSAHCSSSGWSNPTFSISQIDALTNEHMYPLLIGNCCESNKFNVNDCFGEKILMAENKGAVGYIGGSDLTYWDEDFWWAVGASSIVVNPIYNSEKLGAYDRSFHLNGESKEDWYLTQGQMNVAGNLAVEASSSPRKTYYWEIYHLLGDPSLTPYVSIPEVLLATYNTEIIMGSSNFQVLAEEDAYVALSKDGTLLDAKLVGVSGIVDLGFEELGDVGTIDIVITKQNRQPVIDQIEIVPSTTPYVVLNDYSIDDNKSEKANAEVDYGETINLDIILKNISEEFDAFEVSATLATTDTNIIIIDTTENYGTLLKTETAEIKSAFVINVKDKIIDQEIANLSLTISAENSEGVNYNWVSNISLTINAPVVKIKDFLIDDSKYNNDGFIDPGETALLKIKVKNDGNAITPILFANINKITGSSLLTVEKEIKNIIHPINPQEYTYAEFEVALDESEEREVFIGVDFTVEDNLLDFYKDSNTIEFIAGPYPTFLMSETGIQTIELDKAYFYDSGGENGNYSNYEDYTITFVPQTETMKLSANFINFNIEANSSCSYDKLRIYDGNSASSTLIGEYCGTNSPGLVKATNSEGALTFVYNSDYSETRSGWKAEIISEIEAEISTGISQSIIKELRIYPNPSSGIFNVEIPDLDNKQLTIKVYNILGSLIYTNKITGGEKQQINMSNKAAGIYFLSIESDNAVVLNKNLIIK
jgi:hypothetical protein